MMKRSQNGYTFKYHLLRFLLQGKGILNILFMLPKINRSSTWLAPPMWVKFFQFSCFTSVTAFGLFLVIRESHRRITSPENSMSLFL